MGFLSKTGPFWSNLTVWWSIIGPGGILSIVMAWVSSYFGEVARYGWAADVIFGVIITSIFMASAGVLLGGWRKFRPLDQRHKPNASQLLAETSMPPTHHGSQNTLSNALKIEFDEDSGDSKAQQHENGTLQHFLFFRLYNRGNGYLTETRVFLKNTSPPLAEAKIRLMAVPERLGVNEHRTVLLAQYAESSPSTGAVSEHIVLGWTTGGLINRNEIPVFEVTTIQNPLIVSVEATAPQCSPCAAIFKIWVDLPSRKLRAQPV